MRKGAESSVQYWFAWHCAMATVCGFVEDDPETVDGGRRGISAIQE